MSRDVSIGKKNGALEDGRGERKEEVQSANKKMPAPDQPDLDPGD